MLTLTNNTFLIYDVSKAELCEWSIQNTANIPKLLLNYGSPIEKVIFHPKSQNSMLLYGQGFLILVDLDEPIPVHPKQLPDYSAHSAGKRHNVVYQGKRNTSAKTHNFCMINTYRSIVNVAFNDAADLVIMRCVFVSCNMIYRSSWRIHGLELLIVCQILWLARDTEHDLTRRFRK